MTTAQIIETLRLLDPGGQQQVMLTDPVMKWYRMPVVSIVPITVKRETFFPDATGKRYSLQEAGETAIHLKTT